MHDAIQISKLNDFIFSPKSIYYHAIYESFSELLYHDSPQVAGRLSHESIDTHTYSSSTRFLQVTRVYSEKYNLVGKIDIYDKQTKTLIERKTKIQHIYEGYVLQLYAQMFALEEAGYVIEHLKLHSLQDNKRYIVPLPSKVDRINFEKLLKKMRSLDVTVFNEEITQSKLDNCIYKTLYA